MLKCNQAGFSLAETLCAMAVASVALAAGMRLLPLVQHRCLAGIEQLRLARQLDHNLLAIEKDLRRAGHCYPPCTGPQVRIAQRRGERDGSCVILSYAFFPTAATPEGGRLINDTFGYRLRAGMLERQRGVTHCDGGGWDSMLDAQRLEVKQLSIKSEGRAAYRLTLEAALRSDPSIRCRLSRVLAARNP